MILPAFSRISASELDDGWWLMDDGYGVPGTETVETVWWCVATMTTLLKQGVNESEAGQRCVPWDATWARVQPGC